MLRTTLIVMVLLAVRAAAQLDCAETDVVMYQPQVTPGSDPLVPDFNDGSYWTVDVLATVYGDDDWAATSGSASLEDAFFFEHPLGGDTPPDPDLFDEYPALEWDSHYRSTEEGHDPWFAELTNEPTSRYAVWFDTPPNGGEGTFVVARYTVQVTCPETFVVWAYGDHWTLYSGGQLCIDYDWQSASVQEPGDVNRDECVDQADLGILLAAFGSTPDDPNWECAADFNDDGDVDLGDLGTLLAHWGEGCK
ncbi:MAG TPA: dockerin type I domain-containing protein [Phycisphaerae bacterium]|nr:dockerin type I domain-containing protein [Phycisphaerae bacterium]